MADEVERVEYVFEGDVSSLRNASQVAIDMLSKYSETMKRASSSDAFTASQKSIKSMQASINRLTKDANAMQAKLKNVGDIKLPSGSNASKTMQEALGAINSQMVKLDSSNKITTKTLTGFKAELETVRTKLQATTPQIDNMIASEQRFQTVLGTVQSKASNFKDTMSQMQSKMAGTFDPVSTKLKTFSSLFDSIGAKVQAFKDSTTTAFSRVSQLASAVSSAFRRTSQDSDDSAASASRLAQTHGLLGSMLGRLSSAFQKETSSIQSEKKTLKSKDGTLDKSATLHSRLSQVATKLGQTFRNETRRVDTFGAALKGLNGSSGIVTKALQALVGINLADWLAQGIKSSIDFVENLNLFNVAMGDSVERGKAFVERMSEIYGMDPSNLYRYAGYFYQLTDAIGMSDKASASLSLSLTKASNDIASLFNVPIEQVVENLASGMQGMSRAVRKYGMDIRATTLQETAATYGLTQQVETMSEANRMALRYITMMNQVSNALNQTTTNTKGATVTMGDFATTIETPANQLRIFKEQISQLGRAIGNFFVRPLATAIAYINGFVMALRMVINFIGSLLGVISSSTAKVDTSGSDKAAASVGGIGDAASDAKKKLQDLTAPFDELNILQEQTDLGGGGGGGGSMDDVLDPALEDALSQMELKLENIRMKANEVRDAILEFLGFKVEDGSILAWDSSQFEDNLINKFPQWTKTIEAAFDHWSEIVAGFKALFDALGLVIATVGEKLKAFFSLFINDETVSKWIEELGPKLQKLAKYIRENADTIANWIIALGALAVALKVFNVISPVAVQIFNLTSKIISLVTAIARLIATMSPIVLVVTGVIAIFVLAYTQFESVRTAVSNLRGSFEKMTKVMSQLWNTLWVNCLKPIGDNIASMFKELWEKHLSKLVEQFGLAVVNIIDLVMQILTALSGALDVIVSVFGPIVASAFNFIVDIFGTVLGVISDVITRILQIFNGVLEFITGVFSGNWKKAWQGVKDIFKGVFGLIGGIAKGVLNGVIDVINGALQFIWSAIKGFINGVGAAVRQIGNVLGRNWGWTISYNLPKIPHLAQGGVITSPTYAMIGEAGRDEAVIPLDNSPQMRELVQQIAEEIGNRPDAPTPAPSTPIEVKVYIGDREWDAFTYESSKRGEKLVGAQPITIGG